MNRNRIALLIVLALCLPVAARADEASHRAKAQELMGLLHTEKIVQQNSDTMTKKVTAAADKAAPPDATPDVKAKVADFVKQASQAVDAQIGWKAMKEQLADIYAKNFTDEQLDASIAFYKTPAGAASVTIMQDINTQIGQVGGTRLQALQSQLQQLFTDLMKSLAPPAPPPTLGPVSPGPAAPSPAPATPPAAPAAPSVAPAPAASPK